MANKKRIHRELSNLDTILMYRDFLLLIAENSIEITGLPDNIDISKVNSWLIERGQVAWFYDELIGQYNILPFTPTGKCDIYGNPTQIEVNSCTDYNRHLKKGQFIPIYDNTHKTCIYPSIMQFAERIALNRRVEDINIFNQKTPRIFQCSTEQKLSLEKIIQSLDTFNTTILTSDAIDFEKILTDFNPVPFVADKINENGNRVISEFLQLIGICSVSEEKKERLISSEIYFSQGGALVNRLGRINSRKKAFDMINKKYGFNIEVKFYDETKIIKGVLNNVSDMGNVGDMGRTTPTNGESTGD